MTECGYNVFNLEDLPVCEEKVTARVTLSVGDVRGPTLNLCNRHTLAAVKGTTDNRPPALAMTLEIVLEPGR